MKCLYILRLMLCLPCAFGPDAAQNAGEIGAKSALGQANSPSPSPPSPPTPPVPSIDSDDEVFTVIAPAVFGDFTKLDDDVITGFNIDIIEAVCDEADIVCNVVMDSRDTCIQTDQATGVNIPGIYIRPGTPVAGCSQWFETPIRRNFASFTDEYTAPFTSFLVTLSGQPFGSTPQDGDVVAFVTGFAATSACLENYVTTDYEDLFVGNQEEALDAVRDGLAQFAFSTLWESLDQTGLIDTGLSGATCGTGLTIITPKIGSERFISLWNEGFEDLDATAYQQLCQRWQIDSCLPEKLP